jgi:hypothetical protein
MIERGTATVQPLGNGVQPSCHGGRTRRRWKPTRLWFAAFRSINKIKCLGSAFEVGWLTPASAQFWDRVREGRAVCGVTDLGAAWIKSEREDEGLGAGSKVPDVERFYQRLQFCQG